MTQSVIVLFGLVAHVVTGWSHHKPMSDVLDQALAPLDSRLMDAIDQSFVPLNDMLMLNTSKYSRDFRGQLESFKDQLLPSLKSDMLSVLTTFQETRNTTGALTDEEHSYLSETLLARLQTSYETELKLWRKRKLLKWMLKVKLIWRGLKYTMQKKMHRIKRILKGHHRHSWTHPFQWVYFFPVSIMAMLQI